MHAALKNYLALAGGLAEMAKDKALGVSQTVVMQGLTTVTRATGLAEDVRQQGRQNAEAVAALVRFEAARALGRVGLVAAQEVTVLQARVRTLEVAVRRHETVQADVARSAAAAEAAPVTAAPVTAAPVKRPAAKRPAAKTPAARRPAAAADSPALPEL